MDIETIIVGAGVVGLAIARQLALDGHEVLVLDEADAIGSITSSRNSEVIHAGIYYEKDSLKARFCVEGKLALYQYCAERGVPAKALGKLVVAVSDDQIPVLKQIEQKAIANGVHDLRWLDADDVARMEAELSCRAALLSPSSGIIDGQALMLALQGDVEGAGGQVVLRTPVTSIEQPGDKLQVCTSGEEALALTCRNVINAAGLGAQELSWKTSGYPRDRIPPLHYAKGNYFSVTGKTPFSHLVYPIPVPGGLGIHVTLDMGGRVRLGPDLHWVGELEYKPDEDLAPAFYNSVKGYWPGIVDRQIGWSYAGIRPKTTGPGEQSGDFTIHGRREHGIRGLVSMYGIESPGLTSSLSIAKYVSDMIAGS